MRQQLKPLIVFSLVTLFSINLLGQSKNLQKDARPELIRMSSFTTGTDMQLIFTKGSGHNHPTFAVWLQDEEGHFVETLFVTRYFATGIYGFADAHDGTWKDESGESIRPAALPYYAHKRNVISRDSLYVPTPENPIADAFTGATPAGDFIIQTKIPDIAGKTVNIFLEINQAFDWNNYWTNNKYPENKDYKTSGQPSVIYSAKIDLEEPAKEILLLPVGHGHYSGKNGKLFTDLSTLTTALEIADSIKVQLMK